MAADLNQLYLQFENRWTLSNPKPKVAKDVLLFALQVAVAVGAILLSGSRTGNAVAEIGSLTAFGNRIVILLGAEEGWTAAFLAIEAALAFVTFDAAIFLAGYLTGDNGVSQKWYWVLLVVAIIPALFANVFPGVALDEGAGKTFLIIVDVTIGIATPIMAFVAGRVIGASRNQLRVSDEERDADYERRKKGGWDKSPEWKAYKAQAGLNVKAKPETEPKPKSEKPIDNLPDRIMKYLDEAREAELETLQSELDVEPQTLRTEVLRLHQAGKIERNGTRVWLPDY